MEVSVREEMSKAVPRRQWLLSTLVASIGATLVALFYPVVRFLWPRESTSSGAMEAVAPFHTGELRPDAEGQWPAKFTFQFGGKPCLVIRTNDGTVRAFNAVCTHTECTVEYRPEKSDIFCNCHNGVYDVHGRNVSGPPPRPLEEYKVAFKLDDPEQIIVSRSPS